MSKGKNQKHKLLYLMELLHQKTDDGHSLSTKEVQSLLAMRDIQATRQVIYENIEDLRGFGIDIIDEKVGKDRRYHLGTRLFELAELKFLVDAVLSSRFITRKKSVDLINKLTNLASENEAKQLMHQIYVQGRVKSMNESIFYNIDDICEAINSNRIIRFEYLIWDVKKMLKPKHEDKPIYETSPWALVWDNENYYLVGYDEEKDMIKHFRVDKMQKVERTEKKRLGKLLFQQVDVASYTKTHFGMFDGKEQRIRLVCANAKIGILFDRFGTGIPIWPAVHKDWSETEVLVKVSEQFFGWLIGQGKNVRLIGPKMVVEQYRQALIDEINSLDELSKA